MHIVVIDENAAPPEVVVKDHQTPLLASFESEHKSLDIRVVEALSPADEGKRITIDGPIVVGTDESCGLRLTDQTVSGKHALVERSAVGVLVKDLGSSNGTWLVGRKVNLTCVHLGPGQRVRLGGTTLEVQPTATEAVDEPRQTRFGEFVGRGEALQAMYADLNRIAPSETSVVLEGESGVGKELLAKGLHRLGPKPEGPFVVVSCGAIPAELLPSELFGHEKGAFTGSTQTYRGAFERAHGGTLFLDDVSEVPLEQQPQLLRALSEGTVRRIGGRHTLNVETRVIAATNRALQDEVDNGRFRLDLYHRLAVVIVKVPPLREHPEDIELLARRFMAELGATDHQLGPEILDELRTHDWPGNVRELRNRIERLWALGHLGPLEEDELASIDELVRSGMPFKEVRDRVMQLLHQRYTDDMLTRHKGNVSAASAASGIDRRYFQRMRQRKDD